MRRSSAILILLTLSAVALFLALDGTRFRSPPATPPRAEGVPEGILDPGLVEPGSPAGPESETSPSEAATAAGAGRRPLRVELVLVDGSTGRTVRTEPIAFSRRIDPAARVPAPFVVDADPMEFGGPLSVFTERVRLIAVIWPELDLTVAVEEADGTPTHAAELTGVKLAGRKRSFTASRIGSSGEIRIRGVPWMREEPLSVFARAAPPGQPSDFAVEIGPEEPASGLTGLLPDDPVRVLIRLPPLEDPVIRDASVSDHNETDDDMPYEESLGQACVVRPGLRVRVLRADGSPAVRTNVAVYYRNGAGFERHPFNLDRTDGDGVAVFMFSPEDAQVGLAVREPGFLFNQPVAAVPAPGSPEVVLREDPGADMDVFVVDGEDRPLPGARISVDLPNWLWLENGEQRFGLFTGPDGRIRLPKLPLREVTIRAWYGSRHAKVVARAPGSAELRLPRRR